MLSSIPGIRIVCPSNATDAAGLLRTACESGDIVLFLEPKALYARKAPYPGDDYRVPLGVASVRRTGSDVTIACWGNLVPRALQAAETLAEHGIEAEIIDLRTMDSGWDAPTVLQSVDRTGSLASRVASAPRLLPAPPRSCRACSSLASRQKTAGYRMDRRASVPCCRRSTRS
jgi:pyruvate dehydrogenase E1 component beta subunit